MFALLLGSGIPNFDVLPTLLRKNTPDNALNEFHAASLLHTPFFYIATLPLVHLFLIYVLNYDPPVALMLSISYSLGGILHILMECIDEKGRLLLYPFSKKFYGRQILPYDFWTYLKDKRVLTIEVTLFIIAAALGILKLLGLIP